MRQTYKTASIHGDGATKIQVLQGVSQGKIAAFWGDRWDEATACSTVGWRRLSTLRGLQRMNWRELLWRRPSTHAATWPGVACFLRGRRTH